ncbi:4-amino-4-deoxy-L-arabinose transferase-like glycosyltransferase [Oikeobacillus pervagus]|uniref:4-amino-4-deoxy-L-arabinose transferase-like glycosyltransferase n=1 Tax=Oikeobacillus pervagus TaxID=1325931 RepID=A0AAJ1SZ21_9BACI|nr:glycosyltransferase family 39 protein [Oikeobacillus pervagus]MDQ0215264.1 4-amino-4-deoxy-L-arabinose transferase-like glycosyltransferase [Oikeobacillus pervagus]
MRNKERFKKSFIGHLPFVIVIIFFAIVNTWFLVGNPGKTFMQTTPSSDISFYGSRDASLYAKMSWQLIHDGVYGYNATESNAYVTPGQPLYLAAIFKTAEWLNTDHILLYRLANMIINILVAVLIYLIGIQLFKNRWIGFIATLLYCTYFAPFHYFRTALTEIPSLFFFVLSLAIFILAIRSNHLRYHILFGVIASILIMFRPTPAPLLLIGWAIILRREGWREGIKIGFIWCIGPLLIMAPWVARNIYQFGEPYLFSSHAGSPLLNGTNPFYLEDGGEVVQQAKQSGMSLEEYGKQRIREGFANDFPLYFAWFTVGKTIWLFMNSDLVPDGIGPYRDFLPEGLFSFFKWQNLFLVFSSFIFAFIYRKHRPLNYLVYVLILYIFCSNLFLTIPRYGMIMYPILSLLTSYGIVITIKKIQKFITR